MMKFKTAAGVALISAVVLGAPLAQADGVQELLDNQTYMGQDADEQYTVGDAAQGTTNVQNQSTGDIGAEALAVGAGNVVGAEAAAVSVINEGGGVNVNSNSTGEISATAEAVGVDNQVGAKATAVNVENELGKVKVQSQHAGDIKAKAAAVGAANKAAAKASAVDVKNK